MVGLSAFLPVSVHAQEATASAGLVSDYYFQVEEYRKAEVEFRAKKAEYSQIQTLLAREQAVAAYRSFLETRSLATETYLVALIEQLEKEPLVDPAEKLRVRDQLRATTDALRLLRAEISTLTLPEDANELADKFSALVPQITNAYTAHHSLLVLTRVEAVYQKLDGFTKQFEQTVIAAQPDQLKLEFAKRGFVDVKNQNDSAAAAISTAISSYRRYYVLEDRGGKRLLPDGSKIYLQVVQDVQPTYGYVTRSIAFLRELERNVLGPQ